MAGELDEKFAALARSLAAALPEAHLSIVPDAGHAVMLETPQRFLNAVQGFFQRLKAA
jgi:2-succinyl-6-hydroxy-2,4-cyclohexadiene-1-carboxylate synthase